MAFEKERASVPEDQLVNISVPPPIDSSKLNDCGFEGIDERPLDCPNNPFRHPENYRPGICSGCPENPELWKVANSPLNESYIRLKQTLHSGINPWQQEQKQKNEARRREGFEWRSLTPQADSDNIIFNG